MKIPDPINKEAIEEVLKGNTKEMMNIFPWKLSEQGHYYWESAYFSHTLPPEGRTYLLKLLGKHTLKNLLEETN